MTTYADWRAQVDKELQGKPFDKVLVDGGVQPLYVNRPPLDTAALSAPRRQQIVMRHESNEASLDHLQNGADAIWINGAVPAALAGAPVVTDDDTFSTLDVHNAGADAATELAYALKHGRSAHTLRVAVGRDTFTELCKLRALRLCWGSEVRIHAVCSDRTMTVRDPWVNMLRVSTQVFAAMLGGADLITPNAFDGSDHARRVARNTALVLRDESMLGHVADPAGGAYFFDTVTEELIRQARALADKDNLTEHIAALATQHKERIAKRKQPILGVSEFANLQEVVATPPRVSPLRDAAAFEALPRNGREVLLLALDSRPRVDFAAGLFAAGGFTTREITEPQQGGIVCLCGSDDAYAMQGSRLIAQLKADGAHVVVAGKPNPALAADTFIYLGCDAVAVLEGLHRVA